MKTAKQITAMCALAAFVAFPVFADDAQEREKLINAAEATLDKMINEIKGFEKDSSAQDTVDAVKLSVGLVKTIGSLKKVQGDDKTAEDMVDDWPGHIKAFQAASVRLAKMKNLEIALNEAAKDNCEKLQDKLDDTIKAFLPTHDPDGILEIPKTARTVGKTASALLSNGEGSEKMALKTYGEISGFNVSQGDWRTLSSEVRDAAKGMVEAIKKKNDAIERSCDVLAKGDKNPAVVKARQEIAKETGSEMATLQAMVDKWEAKAAKFFKTDCAAMQRMAAMYCDDDIGDADRKDAIGRLHGEARNISSEVSREHKELKEDGKEIRELHKEIAKEKTQKDTADKIIKEMSDELDKIEDIEDGGSIKGFQNPVVQFYVKFGQQMHKRMESSYSCDVRDVAFKGRDRPDCVRAKGCVIFEFKPDSSAGKSAGAKQLGKYKGQVEGHYNAILKAGKENPSKFGGKAIMQAFEKARCINNNTLKMTTKLATYNRCTSKYQCKK